MQDPAEELAQSLEFDVLKALFEDGPAVLLTGAGISTDSGIPDYRGEGTPPRTPMSVHQFHSDHHYRQRFWAEARVGEHHFRTIEPNAGHFAAAQLEAAGLLTGVITQNTDGLHQRGGVKFVAELHGNGTVFRSVDHGHRWGRSEVLQWFDVANPGFIDLNKNAQLNPDGDADVTEVEDVVVPICPACGSMLRPDVVYFGEHTSPTTFALAEQLLGEANSPLVAGSSLAVNTPIRIVNRAQQRGVPIGIINRGRTAIDGRPSVEVRIDGGATEWLVALADELT
ncbi:Sir2 family NAD-dependent protein deacetylase [Actinomyces minihominis]|uniref:Sir2 family NAD-dependent protein deacetylase n=1 Tax=Actinomyces minihominis TaxID=2002838 RepID=UPI001A937676|nr:Sir2 family NAD-dependent protein deacetylase [Actinomyces minihominis]